MYKTRNLLIYYSGTKPYNKINRNEIKIAIINLVPNIIVKAMMDQQ